MRSGGRTGEGDQGLRGCQHADAGTPELNPKEMSHEPPGGQFDGGLFGDGQNGGGFRVLFLGNEGNVGIKPLGAVP